MAPPSSSTALYVGAGVHGLLVFVGAALLGFVVAPFVGLVSGLFPIESDSRSFFSLLTLKGVPYFVGLSTLSAAVHIRFAGRRLRFRAGLLVLNILATWLIGASIALAILG